METIADGDCPSCGTGLPAQARWCGRCGAHRPEQVPRRDPDPDPTPDPGPDDPDPSPHAAPTSGTAGRRTAVSGRVGWFVAGLLAAGLVTLAVSLADRPAEPPTAAVPNATGDDGVGSDPDRRQDGSPDDPTSETDPETGPTTGSGTPDAEQDRARRDSLATCRTVDGDPCGPAYDLDVTATSDVRIVGDHLLALDHQGRISSLSVATGQPRWERPSGIDAPELHLTVAEDDRFAIWSPPRVQVRELEDGEVLWEASGADAARNGTIAAFGSVHLIDDVVILLGRRTVTVLDADTGAPTLQVMHADGQVRLLPDGFAIAEGDQVRRWGTDDPAPWWEETFADGSEVRFSDRPSRPDTPISGAALVIETSPDADAVVLDPSDGRRLLELSGGQHHDIRRLGDLLVSVTWPQRDQALARVIGTRRGATTRTSEVALPCCDVDILPGPDGFVSIASPQIGYDAVLVDVDRGVRLELVRPDEIVGQRTPTTLTATLAMWRSPTGQVGADQLTGRVHWRASASATPISTHPLILVGERSVVWVTAPSGADR